MLWSSFRLTTVSIFLLSWCLNKFGSNLSPSIVAFWELDEIPKTYLLNYCCLHEISGRWCFLYCQIHCVDRYYFGQPSGFSLSFHFVSADLGLDLQKRHWYSRTPFAFRYWLASRPHLLRDGRRLDRLGKTTEQHYGQKPASNCALGIGYIANQMFLPYFSKNSIVVLFSKMRLMWNLRKFVIMKEAAPVMTSPPMTIKSLAYPLYSVVPLLYRAYSFWIL